MWLIVNVVYLPILRAFASNYCVCVFPCSLNLLGHKVSCLSVDPTMFSVAYVVESTTESLVHLLFSCVCVPLLLRIEFI